MIDRANRKLGDNIPNPNTLSRKVEEKDFVSHASKEWNQPEITRIVKLSMGKGFENFTEDAAPGTADSLPAKIGRPVPQRAANAKWMTANPPPRSHFAVQNLREVLDCVRFAPLSFQRSTLALTDEPRVVSLTRLRNKQKFSRT
jgi:hypothetical protein